MFPFPSNVKAYPKILDFLLDSQLYPFPFPSNVKAYPKGKKEPEPILRPVNVFPFPSNVKAYPKVVFRINHLTDLQFQFPSNVKAYPKCRWSSNLFSRTVQVSIPFKRESLSKVNSEFSLATINTVSIPFKREGVSKDRKTKYLVFSVVEFPFPSNGKAYPKHSDSY